MTCVLCGGKQRADKKDHQYTESGLPNVRLVGIGVLTCTKCGDEEVVIPAIADLHRVLARSLVLKAEQLAPAEIRFLRKHLGWNQSALAASLGVAVETISRWENNQQRMEIPAERLLRWLAARKTPVEHYERELPTVAIKKRRGSPVSVERRRSGWRVA
ncbi:MAG: helix-turn-helix domain-containing protein [Vicinamibacteria bacterium]|nr:helix-turn-helix domain-containing protein [Vicinamibacteria bacterium]